MRNKRNQAELLITKKLPYTTAANLPSDEWLADLPVTKGGFDE